MNVVAHGCCSPVFLGDNFVYSCKTGLHQTGADYNLIGLDCGSAVVGYGVTFEDFLRVTRTDLVAAKYQCCLEVVTIAGAGCTLVEQNSETSILFRLL